MQQEALFHGSGEFSALVVLTAKASENLLVPAMKLMALAQLGQQPNSGFPPNLYVLVSIRPDLLAAGDLSSAKATATLPAPFKDEPADVLVQISATTAADRVFGLRLVADCFADTANAVTIQGGRLLNAQENFGFRDGGTLARVEVSSRVGADAQGTWLFFQRMEQNVRAFMGLTPTQKVDVMGRAPGNTLGHPPVTPQEVANRASLVAQAQDPTRSPRSHYWAMQNGGRPLLMVRRGFAYQNFADEGLAFVAVASNPQVFKDALDIMCAASAPDRLLAYTAPREGGVYFCPSVEWITSTGGALPQIVESLRHDTRLVSYTTTEAFIGWMLELRERNVFLPGPPGHRAVLNPMLQPHMDEIYKGVSGTGTPQQKVAVLTALQQEAEKAAGDINETLDDYLTFN
jgi:hypothetical protein